MLVATIKSKIWHNINCVISEIKSRNRFFFLPVCDAPMVYFDCDNATANAHGVECQKSCHTLDMGCVSMASYKWV